MRQRRCQVLGSTFDSRTTVSAVSVVSRGSRAVFHSGRSREPRSGFHRMVAAMAAGLLLSLPGCSTGKSQNSESRPSATSAPSAPDDGHAAMDDPWGAPAETDANLARAEELLSSGLCTDDPPIAVVPSSEYFAVVRVVDGCPVVEYRTTDGVEITDAIAAAKAEPDVVSADFPTHGISDRVAAADPDVPDQWGLERLRFDELPDLAGPRLESVRVAVIDTGINAKHRDLSAAVSNPGLGVLEEPDESCGDEKSAHGSFVAGVIGATAGNGIDGQGLAPGVRISAYSFSNSADAIIRATLDGAQVINMSWAEAGPGCASKKSTEANANTESAIRFALSKGVVLVASAGNCGYSNDEDLEDNRCVGPDQRQYPAAYRDVIAVGSIKKGSGVRIAEHSTKNEFVDVVAPGEAIRSVNCLKDSGTTVDSGTSYAAPFVAATAALLLARDPTLTTIEVSDAITRTASGNDPLPHGQFDDPRPSHRLDTGYGLVDPVKALESVEMIAGSQPSPTLLGASVTTRLCDHFNADLPDVSFTPEFDGSELGDLNGDGLDDAAIIVRCTFPEATSYLPNDVYVMLGTTDAAATPSLIDVPIAPDVDPGAEVIDTRIRDGVLIVRTRSAISDANCCPHTDIEEQHRLRGNRFERSELRVLTFESEFGRLVEVLKSGRVEDAQRMADADVATALFDAIDAWGPPAVGGECTRVDDIGPRFCPMETFRGLTLDVGMRHETGATGGRPKWGRFRAIDAGARFPDTFVEVLGSLSDAVPEPIGSGCSPSGDALADGVYFGFVTPGLAPSSVNFDLACYYSSARMEARGLEALQEDNVENVSTRSRTLPVAAYASYWRRNDGGDQASGPCSPDEPEEAKAPWLCRSARAPWQPSFNAPVTGPTAALVAVLGGRIVAMADFYLS